MSAPKREDGRPRMQESSRSWHQPAVCLNDGKLATVTDKATQAGLRPNVYFGLPVAGLDARFDAVMGMGHSVSIFTDWREDVPAQVLLLT